MTRRAKAESGTFGQGMCSRKATALCRSSTPSSLRFPSWARDFPLPPKCRGCIERESLLQESRSLRALRGNPHMTVSSPPQDWATRFAALPAFAVRRPCRAVHPLSQDDATTPWVLFSFVLQSHALYRDRSSWVACTSFVAAWTGVGVCVCVRSERARHPVKSSLQVADKKTIGCYKI